MNEPTDYRGRAIKVGDILVYPVRRGSKMWLNQVIVTKTDPDRIYGENPEGRRIQLTNLRNTIVA